MGRKPRLTNRDALEKMSEENGYASTKITKSKKKPKEPTQTVLFSSPFITMG